ncbi:MAG: hypothetical protein Q8Q89_02530 [bacterium]|nr:hypothetical protein [bacterium]
MTKQELVISLGDTTVSDEQIVKNILEYSSKYDSMGKLGQEELGEFEEVSEMTWRTRPKAMVILLSQVNEQPDGCCRKRPE